MPAGGGKDMSDSHDDEAVQTVEVIDRLDQPGARWRPREGPEATALLRELSDVPAPDREQLRRESLSVLSSCAPPRPPDETEIGLVFGHVQSGKTMSFTIFTALARDNGFPLVIVVTGTSHSFEHAVERPHRARPSPPDTARSALAASPQPEAAGRAGAGGRPGGLARPGCPDGCATDRPCDGYEKLVASAESGQDASPARPSRSSRTCHRRRGRPGRVEQPCKPGARKHHVRPPPRSEVCSPSSHVSRVHGDASGATTHQSHRCALSSLCGGAHSRHELRRWPRVLPRARRGRWEIPANQIITPTNQLHEPPLSLLEAMRILFLGVAAGIVEDGGEGNRSMMVHPSQHTGLHADYARWVREIRETWQRILELPEADLDRKELLEEFHVAYEKPGRPFPNLLAFPDLVRVLHRSIRSTLITEVNAVRGRTPEVNWRGNYSHILVGERPWTADLPSRV